MDSSWLILINAIMILGVGGWLFKYFDTLFTAQADLIDRILQMVTDSGVEIISPPDEGFLLQFEDSQRTHILGGVIDMGTHTTGVCHPDCWCNEEE